MQIRLIIALAVFAYFTPLSYGRTTQKNVDEPYVKIALSKTVDGKVLDIQAHIVVDASREQIWRVMTDCVRAGTYVPGLKKCEVLESASDGSWDIRRHIGKGNGLFKGSKSEFKSFYTYPRHIDVMRTGGDYKKLDAEWILEALDKNKTKIIYNCELSAKTNLPNGLVKSFVKKRMKKTLKALNTEVISEIAKGQTR